MRVPTMGFCRFAYTFYNGMVREGVHAGELDIIVS